MLRDGGLVCGLGDAEAEQFVVFPTQLAKNMCIWDSSQWLFV
jgi:hypothetical protein